ncbi:MAG: ABC transporter permease [Thermoleophilaceae bacterium]
MSASTPVQVRAIAWRSLIRTARQPAQVVPAITFPLMLFAINAGGLDAAAGLRGFPAPDYLTFILAVPFIQAGIFAVAGVGADLARDIESGFLDRMALTPVSRTGLVSGQVAGTIALGVVQGVVFLSVGLAAGARLETGAAGALVLVALVVCIVFAFGLIGVTAAFRFGNGEAVQGLFPVLFVFLFLSTMGLPLDLLEKEWFQTVATYNPVSHMLDGIRSLFYGGWDGEALALAFAMTAGIVAVFLPLAIATLRQRVVRT